MQEVSDDLGRIEKRLSPRDAIDADVVFDARLDRQKCRMSTGRFHGTNAEQHGESLSGKKLGLSYSREY